jgi:hypothetical protein
MIPIAGQTADRAEMPTLTQVFLNTCATKASLRRAARVNLQKRASGPFCLVRKFRNERRPPRVVNGFAESTTNKPANIQSLNRNEPVCVDDLPRLFMVKISALFPNAIMELLNKLKSFMPAVRTLPTTHNAALQSSQLSLRVFKPTRIGNCASVAQSSELRQTHINPYGFSFRREWRNVTVNTEYSEPFSSLPCNGKRLNDSLHWAVKLNSNLSNPHQPKFIASEGFTYLPIEDCQPAIIRID